MGSNRSDLTRIGLGAAGVLAVCAGVCPLLWDSFGVVGLAGLVVVVSGLVLVVANRMANTDSVHQIQAHAPRQTEWSARMAEFPERTHYALRTLADEWDAQLLWTNPDIGLGRPRSSADDGDWPRLLPGTDPGHKPDPGFRVSPVGARVRLLLPAGPSREDVITRLPRLATALKVPDVGIVASDGEQVTLELRVRNPLADTIPFPRPEASPVPLKALRVARREDGDPYRLRVWNNHLFLAGVTGSGKSGVLWSIVGALAPDIATGRVELHVIDLKRGGEMAAGYRLFSSWAYHVADAIAVLEKLLDVMRARLDERREHAMATGEPIRNHEPEPGDPHHVLLIDEFIALIGLVGDVKGEFNVPQLDGTTKRETIRADKYIGRLLMEMLSQSRAVGFTLIAATQNAAKAIFEVIRDMFSVTIGLRQASAQQMQMVFGTGAGERGVDATAITVDQAGTAFVDSPEAGGMAQRIRFFRVTDDDITNLVNVYGRPKPIASTRPVLVDKELAPAPTPAVSAARTETDNVVEIRRPPVEAPLIEQTPAPGRCRFCGVEIQQTPGGRPALYCPNSDHRQKYHRLKRQLAAKDTKEASS